jgi:hypothetical protein
MKPVHLLTLALFLAIPSQIAALDMTNGDVEVRNLGSYGFTAGNSYLATDAGAGDTDQLFQMFGYVANGTGSTRVDASSFSVLSAIGATGVDTAESSITLNGAGATALGLNAGDLEIDYLFRLFDDTGASDRDRLEWEMSFTNTTASAMSFSFYSYIDLDLEGAADFGDDTAAADTTRIVVQDASNPALEYIFYSATQAANRFQVGAYPGLRNQLDAMGSAQNLTNAGATFGPGDFTGAFQYDITLAAGQTFSLLSSVPEPSGAALLIVALLAGARLRRR